SGSSSTTREQTQFRMEWGSVSSIDSIAGVKIRGVEPLSVARFLESSRLQARLGHAIPSRKCSNFSPPGYPQGPLFHTCARFRSLLNLTRPETIGYLKSIMKLDFKI